MQDVKHSYLALNLLVQMISGYDRVKCLSKTEKVKEQAGAELGQAQPQLGFWKLISFSFKV